MIPIMTFKHVYLATNLFFNVYILLQVSLLLLGCSFKLRRNLLLSDTVTGMLFLEVLDSLMGYDLARRRSDKPAENLSMKTENVDYFSDAANFGGTLFVAPI
jgi:hypothetical protein